MVSANGGTLEFGGSSAANSKTAMKELAARRFLAIGVTGGAASHGCREDSCGRLAEPFEKRAVLAEGSTKSARIEKSGDVDWMRFRAQMGQTYRFELAASQLQGAQLTILNEKGSRELAEVNVGTNRR